MTPISKGEKTLMLMVSVAFDVAEIILSFLTFKIFTLFSGLLAWAVFAPWFRFHGATFIRKVKKGPDGKPQLGAIKASRIIGLVLESLPFISFLPIFSFNVWSQINHINKSLENTQRNEKIVREKRPTRLEQRNARNN